MTCNVIFVTVKAEPYWKFNPYVVSFLLISLQDKSCNNKRQIRGAPGALVILGEGLFIFRELESTGHYFQGSRKQAHSLGGLRDPCKKLKINFKNLTLNDKVRKRANIRNQVPHLTQDTNGKVTNIQLDITNESQKVSPFPAGDHKHH